MHDHAQFDNSTTHLSVPLQGDGNFVIYGWGPKWASDTDGQTEAKRISMQADGNLVMYRANNTPMWSTSTYAGKPVVDQSRLELNDDGKLVILVDGKEVWNSTNNRGTKE